MNNKASSTKFIDLKERGFQEACQSFGNSETFKSTVAQIKNGNLIDESIGIGNNSEIIENEKLKINEKLHEKNEKIIDIGNDIIDVENKIKELNTKLDLVIENPNDKRVSGDSAHFKWGKFLPLLFVFICVSVFLGYYYTGVPYMSFVKPCDQNTLMFPEFASWMRIIHKNPQLIFFPSLFFAFGISLHFALDYKKWVKITLIISLIIITFLLDIRMAINIHDCMDQVNFETTGNNLIPWHQSGIVYILFLLGFVVFFLWSFMYHTLLKEWDKRDILNNLKSAIKRSEEKLSELKNKLRSNKGHKTRLEQILIDLNEGSVITPNMKSQSIELYKEGFFSLLTFRKDIFHETLDLCNNLINNEKLTDLYDD